jgi:predicted metal-dependent phosphoesterase TrpH
MLREDHVMPRPKVGIDLHMHTTFSDGVLSPQQLVEKAHRVGLKVISITDHDNVDAIEEAKSFACNWNLEVIPGVELSVSHEDQDIHILAYFIDHHNEKFESYLSFFRDQRRIRATRIVNKLNKLGIKISIDKVFERAGKGSVGRPHIAYVMMQEGCVKNFDEAFNRYIGAGCPAYEKNYEVKPAEVFELVTKSGGLSFLAHPGRSISDDTVRFLIENGLDGLEIVHPSHSIERQEYYREITNEYFLLQSGGSDYHGVKSADDLNFGTFGITEHLLQMMRNRLS